jgi:curli biogenesis system outer membrane secretion channel CsgG
LRRKKEALLIGCVARLSLVTVVLLFCLPLVDGTSKLLASVRGSVPFPIGQNSGQSTQPSTETTSSSGQGKPQGTVKPRPITTPPSGTPTPSGIKSNVPGGDAGLEANIPKPKVLILAFDYGSVKPQVSAVYGTDQDIGRGISDLLANQLARDGKYQVVDRNKLQRILQEQNFSASSRMDSMTAARIGKLVGADAIVIGDITQFGSENHAGKSGLGGFGATGIHKSKAIVEVTARVVDVNTGEITASATGRGESTRSGTSLIGGGLSNSATRPTDMASSAFGQTILGEAVNGSVKNLAQELDVQAKNPERSIEITGLVADTSGNQLILNVGTAAGLRTGYKFSVVRTSRVIKDPVTGQVLRKVDEPIGQAVVTSADEHSAVATFIGEKQPKVGDVVQTLRAPSQPSAQK